MSRRGSGTGRSLSDELSFPHRRPFPGRLAKQVATALLCLAVTYYVVSVAQPASILHSTSLSLSSVEEPAPCSRALLIDWGSWNYGFGASLLAMLHATIFAEVKGFPLLVARNPSIYGRYLDYFIPSPTSCLAEEPLFDAQACIRGDNGCITTHGAVLDDPVATYHDSDRVLFMRFGIYGMNRWYVHNTSFAQVDLERLPKLTSSRPLLGGDSLPPGLVEQYDYVKERWDRHFSFNALVEADINAYKADLQHVGEPYSALIGVHFRGGDKLGYECTNSAIMSCGNVTMHAEAAWNAYVDLHPDVTSRARQVKPTMLLLTAEPGMVAHFQQDPMGSRFKVVEWSHRPSHHSYSQGYFNSQSMEDRVADTKVLFADLAVLARHADAFIVSNNSNLGRIAFLLAGKKRILETRMRGFDLYWFPTLFKPIFDAGCFGDERCHP